MKKLLAGLCGFALLSLISPVSPAQAQTRTAETRPAGPFGYDITKEVTLHGAVSSVHTIRNEHGAVMSPQARERASQKAAQKGESL
jgi:hypothetical protein